LHADAILVTHLPNILYLTGFTGSSAILLLTPDRSCLFTDSRYTFQAKQEVSAARVQIAKGPLLLAAAGHLAGLRRRGRLALAYSPSQVTVGQREALERTLGSRLRWVPMAGLIEKLRAIKDLDELSLMRRAAELISRAFSEALPVVKEGATELDVAAEIEYRMKRLGASGPSFETIVASGEHSAWAHARPTSKPIRKNELVVLDQGAILRAYCSDMTRTVFLGRASSEVRRMYSAVREAQEAAKSAIRPGVKAQAVDAAARRVLKAHHLARRFTHSTGHGLGLEIHEPPRLGRGDETVLEEGMVVTVEPGVYIEGFGGIRIEDDVVVTSRGADEITSAPRELLEL